MIVDCCTYMFVLIFSCGMSPVSYMYVNYNVLFNVIKDVNIVHRGVR